jgi:radical SAM protein with 4Fe4S-binding SPASM domain
LVRHLAIGEKIPTPRFWPYSKQALQGLARRRVDLKANAIPYRFSDLPRRKVINAILAEGSVYRKPSRPWAMPTHLQVEPSAHCNLHCALCAVTTGLGRPQGHMDLELFKRLLDETGDYVFTLIFFDWGEPFVNPDAFEMIAYAKTKRVKVIASTNGHIFTRKEKADQLIRSGLDSIIFAIDGVTQETYERYRQGGTLATALAGLRMVTERKKALGSKTPLVNFRFIAMAHNEHEIPLVKKLAPSLGADALTFKTVNPFLGDTYADREQAETERGLLYLPKDERYRRFKLDPRTGRPRRRRRNPCRQLWTTPSIHWDGTICPCTFDSRERYPLGNLNEQSFREIWQGEAYRELRRRFRSDRDRLELCADCTYAYEGGDCSRESIAEAIFYTPPI